MLFATLFKKWDKLQGQRYRVKMLVLTEKILMCNITALAFMVQKLLASTVSDRITEGQKFRNDRLDCSRFSISDA